MEQTKQCENVEEHPGRTLYNTQIRPIVETDENIGKFCIVHKETGDYEIDADGLAADNRLRARHHGAVFWGERIGYRGYCEFSGLFFGFSERNVMEQTKSTEDIETHPGRALYQEHIRPIVETEDNIGKFCLIDAETGDYEIDANSVSARKRLRARHPGVIFWGERIGYRSYCSFGYVDARDAQK